jgi:DNA-binding NarL/FixJ family response regulator
MPILNGLEAAHRLIGHGLTSKIIFLTVHEDADFLQAALRAGASGYVIKRCLASDLCEAVKQVLAGKTFISDPLRQEIERTRLSA